jgi:hypothetical protein
MVEVLVDCAECRTADIPRRDNPYQPPCLHDLFYLQPQPRDRRAPTLVVVHALYVDMGSRLPQFQINERW